MGFGNVIDNRHLHTLAGLDIVWLADHQARTRPDKTFLIWEPFDGPGDRWTYARFHHDTRALAAGLAARGVGPGDFVLIHLENCPETVLAWHACARLGAIAVTTNTRVPEAELAYFADHCGARVAITQPRFADLVAAAAPTLRWIAVTAHDAGAPPAAGHAPGRDGWANLFDDPADAPQRPYDPLAPVGVQYTSGTTSRPKGVLWTHANALWGAMVNANHERLVETDVHLVQMPLFHTNAQAYSVMSALYVGASAVILPRFSASRFWDVALKHRCTWASMIPFFVKALMDQPVPRHAFRLWGGAFTSPRLEQHFGLRTMGWWGMTETMTHGIVSDPLFPQGELMIGRPAPEYRIAITHDDGSPVAPGETGDLKVGGIRGLSLFAEYLNNPRATADSFDADGWFLTGDRVTLHADGCIQFADRAKDMLKVGGENVAASEIEFVIMQVPGVREAAVVAQKHPMLDEVPYAFVLVEEGRPTEDPTLVEAILAACRRELADFKQPRAVELVADLPRATLEKIAKAELRRRLSDRAAAA